MNQTQEVGFVTKNRNFLTHLDGFPTIRVNDLVQSDNGMRGWVNSISSSEVEVLMLDEGSIKPGQSFKRLPAKLALPIGDFLLSRSINPLGVPIDGKGLLTRSKNIQSAELDQKAPGIEYRQFITSQFLTGITLIDTLIPIGRGQRELILGDAHSGKTSTIIDIIINQKKTGIICVLGLIGKPSVTIRSLIDTLSINKALDYTVIVATSSSDPAPFIFLTPKAAFSVAEYFQKKGRDVLLILDDLGAHAKIYREISLLGNKSPGRESYPGDIFYQHAHLLERAGNFLPKFGGGSITALPVIEVNLSDFTTLIPTNLMSMTDGHLLFKSSLQAQGQTPAIDISLSVSRVGRQTQGTLSNLLSTRVRQVLSEALDLETISRFSSELSVQTRLTLQRREQISELLKQEPLTAIVKQVQLILLSLPFTTFLQNKPRSYIEKYKNFLVESFMSHPKLIPITKSVSKLKTDEELIRLLEGAEPVLTKLLK